MDSNLQNRLISKLDSLNYEKIKNIHVVLLPDFFVDHFLILDDINKKFNKIKKIYDQGGGNIPNIQQKISQGGNSANTALALARLGFNSHLICKTDDFGLNLLNFFLGKHNVDLSQVKTDGKLAITTALEFKSNNSNIMLGDTASVSDFSFDNLDQSDLDLIANSDLLCVTTWNLNNKGSNLAKKAFDFAKNNNTKTYFDTGDPSPKKDEIPYLLENVINDNNLDILGLNENELSYYSGINASSQDEIVNAVYSLKEKVNARIDFHTADFTGSIKDKPIIIPTIDIATKYRSTGAGDAWNAGNIFGELLGFNDDERLLFANCVAGLYISSPNPLHPDLKDINNFLKNLGKI